MNPEPSGPLPGGTSRLSQALLIVLGIVGLAFLFITIQRENAAIAAWRAPRASAADSARK
jgi:hypothetical protein